MVETPSPDKTTAQSSIATEEHVLACLILMSYRLNAKQDKCTRYFQNQVAKMDKILKDQLTNNISWPLDAETAIVETRFILAYLYNGSIVHMICHFFIFLSTHMLVGDVEL